MLGHTAAWKVKSIDQRAYGALKRHLRTDPTLAAAIARHQLEMAIRRTNENAASSLKLIGRGIVDASDEHVTALPIIAVANKRYDVNPNLFAGPEYASLLDCLRTALHEVRSTIHSTIVADIVKRFIRDRLGAFPLRAHGGVYFVSVKREDGLFDLETYLKDHGIGTVTHIRVMGNDHEINLLTAEVKRLISSRVKKLRAAILAFEGGAPDRMHAIVQRVKELRAELSTMQALFSFAAGTIEERDQDVQALLMNVFGGDGLPKAAGFSLGRAWAPPMKSRREE